MRAEARPVTETSLNGTPIEKVEFKFTISLRQMQNMTSDEIIALIARMSRFHVAGAKGLADREMEKRA